MGFDMNYKIKVANEVESTEVQNLFLSLGGKRHEVNSGRLGLVVLAKGIIYVDSIYFEEHYTTTYSAKEITLPELRDLVVLKHNSIEDATHVDKEDHGFKYRLINNEWHVINRENLVWRKDSIDLNDAPLFMKPIEKKEMKEYLVKNQHDEYALLNDVSCIPEKFAIEVPKGSVKAYLNNSGTINFVNADDDYMNGVTHGEWVDTHRGRHESSGHQLVWKRESMKEDKITKDYLEKQPNGSYVMKSGFALAPADWIEIPEGAFSLKENFIFFNQDSSKFYSSTGEWLKSPMTNQLNSLWQRSESPNDKLASAEQYRQAEVLPFIDDEPKSAWDTQVGGDHYKKYKIQPMLFALENNLNPLQHSVLKYIMRHEDKNGKQDLEKAKHYIDLMIAHYYPTE